MRTSLAPQPLAHTAIKAVALSNTAMKIAVLCHFHCFDAVQFIALPPLKYPGK
jgi:hypothetical protein